MVAFTRYSPSAQDSQSSLLSCFAAKTPSSVIVLPSEHVSQVEAPVHSFSLYVLLGQTWRSRVGSCGAEWGDSSRRSEAAVARTALLKVVGM